MYELRIMKKGDEVSKKYTSTLYDKEDLEEAIKFFKRNCELGFYCTLSNLT